MFSGEGRRVVWDERKGLDNLEAMCTHEDKCPQWRGRPVMCWLGEGDAGGVACEGRGL